MNFLNLFCLVFLGLSLPFKTRFKNRLELFNEFTVVTCTLLMMTFTQYVPDVETQYMMGWSMIGVIVFNFLVNLTIIISVAIKLFYLVAKKYYKRIRHFIKP